MVLEKDKSFSNLILWRFFQGAGQQVLQFIVGIILARILMPDDFGKIAVLTVFFVFANTLVDSGLGVALVREKNVSRIDYQTVFTFNLGIAILLYLMVYIFAPDIAKFYNDNELILISRVVGVKILISSFTIVNYSILRRSLNIKGIALVSVIASLTSGFIAILMAYLEYGVWSIVCQQLALSFCLLLGYSLVNEKRVLSLGFSKFSFTKLFGFGGYLLFATMISRLSDNIYSLLIGRYYSMSDVGFFSRAQSLHYLPLKTVNKSVSDAVTPKLYKMQDDKNGLVHQSRRILQLMNFISLPLIALMYIFSEDLVILLLTDKWIQIIPFFRIFLIAALFYSQNVFSQIMFKALGKANIFFRIELFSKILFIALVVLAVNYSMVALALCSVFLGISLVFLNMYFLNKLVKYSVKNLFQDYKLSLLSTLIMSIILLMVNYSFNLNHLLLDTALKSFLALILYFILNVLFKNEFALSLISKIVKN